MARSVLRGPFRRRRSQALVAFVCAVFAGGLSISTGVFISPGLSGIVAAVLIVAWAIVVARTFRGRDEPGDGPRSWWRLTCRPVSALLLGVPLVLLGPAIAVVRGSEGWNGLLPWTVSVLGVAYCVSGIVLLRVRRRVRREISGLGRL